MKRIIWRALLLIAMAALIYFIGVPALTGILEAAGKPEVELISAELAQESQALDGWVKQVEFTYVKRSIPSLEKEFMTAGYPPFLYLADGVGNLDLKGEKSYHEDGMAVYLYMDDSYYLERATMEYTVAKKDFSSIQMGKNLPPLVKFIEIITGAELDEEARNQLLRAFTDVFNDSEGKEHMLVLNNLEFRISLERNWCMIILTC